MLFSSQIIILLFFSDDNREWNIKQVRKKTLNWLFQSRNRIDLFFFFLILLNSIMDLKTDVFFLFCWFQMFFFVLPKKMDHHFEQIVSIHPFICMSHRIGYYYLHHLNIASNNKKKKVQSTHHPSPKVRRVYAFSFLTRKKSGIKKILVLVLGLFISFLQLFFPFYFVYHTHVRLFKIFFIFHLTSLRLNIIITIHYRRQRQQMWLDFFFLLSCLIYIWLNSMSYTDKWFSFSVCIFFCWSTNRNREYFRILWLNEFRFSFITLLCIQNVAFHQTVITAIKISFFSTN